MRNIEQIISDAGKAEAIAAHLPKRFNADGTERDPKWAIYKWKANGIPSRHWPVLIKLAKSSADELMKANAALERAQREGEAA